MVKNPAIKARHMGSVLGSGKFHMHLRAAKPMGYNC